MRPLPPAAPGSGERHGIETSAGREGESVRGEVVEDASTPHSRHSRSKRAKAIPPDVRKLGRILLDQQMWCFGRDISRAAGNALIEYGFSKVPPPDGTNTPSCYVREESADRREIRLWGFGIVYSEEDVGSLYLERRKFSPKLLPGGRFDVMAWRASEMPRCRMPRSERERTAAWRPLAGASERFSEYETWVRDGFGEEYRRACVASWPKKSPPAEVMPEAWMELARFFGGGMAISNSGFDGSQ